MTPPRKDRERGGAMGILVGVLAGLLILAGLYTWFVLWWAYSEGERAGYVQKFSRKGYVCKTWEGELAMTTVPGTAPTLWVFTVRDPAIVRQIQDAVGKRVALHYTEHIGVPTACFGDTPYYVDGVRLIEDGP
jgi:hypothetical protein